MTLMNSIGPINAYIRTKPWTLTSQSGALIFGIEESGEKISFVVVSGAENGYGLALCADSQALVGYAALLHAVNEGADEMERISLQLDQNYLEMRLVRPEEEALNQWLKSFGVVSDPWPENQPVFRKHQPGRLPRPVDESEEALLAEAMYAAADLTVSEEARRERMNVSDQLENGSIPCAKRLEDGSFAWKMIEVSKNMQIQYPSPALDDELAARRLRRLPVSGSELICAVRRLPMPLDENAERVPTVMLLLDDQQGIVGAPIIEEYDRDYGELAGTYLEYVEEYGRPKRILAADPRAYCLLTELAAQMSTPIQRVSNLTAVNDAMRMYMEYLRSSAVAQTGGEAEPLEEEIPENPERNDEGGSLIDHYSDDREGMLKHFREAFGGEGEDGAEENLLIRVTCPDEPAYWMYLAAKKDAALRQLDREIRRCWFSEERNLSRFEIGGERYSSDCRKLRGSSMNAQLKDTLRDVLSFEYQYDEERPTALRLETFGTVMLPPRRKNVHRIACNYMPVYACVCCGQRAKMVRPGEGAIAERTLCMQCAEQDAEKETLFELGNTPRTGVEGFCLFGEYFF